MLKGKLNIGSKKGNVPIELITLVLLIVVFLIFALVSQFIFKSMTDDMVVDDTLNQDVKDMIEEEEGSFGGFMDGLVLFLFIGLWLFVLISAFMLDSNPIFFVIALIALIVMLVVVVFVANIYDDIVSDDGDFESIKDSFPISSWIMEHLLIVGIVVGFSILLVLYGKSYIS